MPEISAEVITLLQYLAPGFLVTWVYFRLTSHEKPPQFDRTVQALIYTAVVHALVAAERQIASWIGEWRAFGKWDADSALAAAVMSAVLLGIVVATTANHDLANVVLRKLKVTHRTSHPGEWFSALSENSQAIVLHLKKDSGSTPAFTSAIPTPRRHHRGPCHLPQRVSSKTPRQQRTLRNEMRLRATCGCWSGLTTSFPADKKATTRAVAFLRTMAPAIRR